MNSEFVIFVTTFIEQYQDFLIKFLLKEGYSVSAFSNDSSVSVGNNGLFVVAIKATKLDNKTTRNQLYNSIKSMFAENQRSYLSIIIQELNDTSKTTWGAGKIFYPESKEKSIGSPFRDSSAVE